MSAFFQRCFILLCWNDFKFTNRNKSGIIIYMKRESKIQKQKGFLQIAFAIVLAVSFVLVLYENIRINKQEQNAESSAQGSLNSMVKGQSVNTNHEINDYGRIVRDAIIILNKNIDLISQGKAISAEEVQGARDNLLLAQVPDIFQKLHINLVSLASDMLDTGDIDSSKENIKIKQGNLFNQYPWLKTIIIE